MPVTPRSLADSLPMLVRMASLLLLAALVGAVSPPVARAQGGGRSAQMEAILARLAERAALYESTALRFSCREQVRVVKYGSDEEIRKQEVDYHDYLLEYTERDGLQPYRAILSHNGTPTRRRKVEPDYAVPEPYGWNLLFTAERQGRFQFRLVEEEIRPPHLLWVIEFVPLLSYTDGNSIDEWEGTVWVDQDTLDIVQVEATPAHQEDTLEARAAEYRQSFRVLGIGTKKRPRARRLRVEFGITREGLRFPSRSFAATRILDSLGENGRLKRSVSQSYDTYVFYGVDTLEEFERRRAESP